LFVQRDLEATREGLTQVDFLRHPVREPVMLSAAKHLVCRAIHVSRPEMLRCAQH